MGAIGEKILTLFSYTVEESDRNGATNQYTLANAMEFACRTVPNFMDYVRGKSVLDYGCGPGYQVVALALGGAREVTGVDINEEWLSRGRRLAAEQSVSEKTHFSLGLPSGKKYDVVISLGAFEHFADSAAELKRMSSVLAPGSRIIISFAEPWLSHSGSHFSGYVRIPWVNILFAEETLMKFRRRYRSDGATRFEDIVGGLNRMTVAKFDRIIGNSGLEIEMVTYHATKGLPLVTGIPIVRELLTSGISCVLRKPA